MGGGGEGEGDMMSCDSRVSGQSRGYPDMWKGEHDVVGDERKHTRGFVERIYLLHGEGAGSEFIRQARDTP